MGAWVSSAEGDRQVAMVNFHRREVAAVTIMDAVCQRARNFDPFSSISLTHPCVNLLPM